MDIIPSTRIVILKPAELPDIVEGKLMAVEKTQPLIGEVISYGQPGYFDTGQPMDFPLPMEKGDIIAYRQFGQSKFYISGQEIIFCNFSDILGILKKGKKK